MPSAYTVDASVFLSAFNPLETGHIVSASFLSKLQSTNSMLIEPTLLLAEVAGTISRGQNNPMLALAFARTLAQLPQLQLLALTPTLADQTAEVAAAHRLRGSDAVYAAVALHSNSVLVTLDREQLTRVANLITTQTPTDALATL